MSKARNLSAFISEAAIDATEMGANSVTTTALADLNVTHAKLHTDMNLSSKTLTLGNNQISGNAIDGGVISNFASTGIDDNSSATAVTIDSGLNVGIGTSSPTARLDVRRGDADGKIAEFHQSTGYGIDIGSSQSVAYISSGYNQRLDFKTDPTSGQTERMSILANGNVGIGTSSPSAKLTVYNGNILLDGPSGSDPRIDFHQPTNTGEGGVIVYNDSDEVFTIASRMATYGDINFATGMNDGDPTDLSYSKMFIRANGNVGIGATNPAAKLHVDGDGGYSWGNGTYTKLGTVSRYDMGGYNSGASNVSRQLLYYAYDQANWNTQYLKVIVRHSYYYTGGEAA